MDLKGLSICSRYAYPPNSFLLCGPDKRNDLKYYSEYQSADKGTAEIISSFATLFPYLKLIAEKNKIFDPFSTEIVEAYWIGNSLLKNISGKKYISFLTGNIELKKKVKKSRLENIFDKVSDIPLPHHSFHVLNIYKRTGHLDIPQTVETMDACIINSGKVTKKTGNTLEIETRPLIEKGSKLIFGNITQRTLKSQGEKDVLMSRVKPGDIVSYHWGYFCEKLIGSRLNNLNYFTDLSLLLCNKDI